MKFWNYIFGLLVLILVVIALAITQIPDSNLHIVACNIGQGDAILIVYKNIQILTDGGPDKSVLNCLGSHIPFWDKDIELVVSTHPDADHSTGLVEVSRTYNIEKMLINSTDPGTSIYKVLKNEVGGRGIEVINPIDGMSLRVDMIRLDIVNPTETMLARLSIENEGDKLTKYSIKNNTNLYSIVYKLSFKNFSGLFTGDMPPEVSDRLSESGKIGKVNYIKIPHHGSVNGMTENLLKETLPGIAVISVGKNPWGFPRPEIMEMLAKYGIRVFRTDTKGDIEIITDGSKIWKKN